MCSRHSLNRGLTPVVKVRDLLSVCAALWLRQYKTHQSAVGSHVMWCMLIPLSSSAKPSCCHNGARRDSVLSVAGSSRGWRQGAGCTHTGRTHPQRYIPAASIVQQARQLLAIFIWHALHFFSHVRFDVGNTTAATVLTLFTHCNKMVIITILQIDPLHVITDDDRNHLCTAANARVQNLFSCHHTLHAASF